MEKIKIDDAAKYVALISACLYAAGYLIVNSHLAKYGDLDPDFASSRYIFAGFLFVWYLLFVGWIVFRYMHELISQASKFDTLHSLNKKMFYMVIFQSFGTELILRICLSSIFFGLTMLDNVIMAVEVASIVLGLSIVGYIIEKFGAKRFWIQQISLSTIQAVAIFVFLIYAETQDKIIASTYFLSTLYFTYLYEPVKRRLIDFEAKSQITYWSISSISVVIIFGSFVYGHVKHQYGGGMPVKVTVYTKSDAGTAELAKAASGGFSVEMIALNDKKLIGISGGKLAIINADGIASVVYPDK